MLFCNKKKKTDKKRFSPKERRVWCTLDGEAGGKEGRRSPIWICGQASWRRSATGGLRTDDEDSSRLDSAREGCRGPWWASGHLHPARAGGDPWEPAPALRIPAHVDWFQNSTPELRYTFFSCPRPGTGVAVVRNQGKGGSIFLMLAIPRQVVSLLSQGAQPGAPASSATPL